MTLIAELQVNSRIQAAALPATELQERSTTRIGVIVSRKPCRRPFATGGEAMTAVVERLARMDPGRVASPAPPRWWPTLR
jgi:hypothetical protein